MRKEAFGLTIVFCAIFILSSMPASTQTFTILHTFTGPPHTLGPSQGLMLDSRGNLYGTTYGLLDGARVTHYGTVFRINNNGALTSLQKFSGPNGANPLLGHLVRDAQGNLYGVTTYGGILASGALGNGTIYKIDKNGQETVLYVFKYKADGSSPRGTLVRDSAGNLYGTTLGTDQNYGTVFKFNTSGQLHVLHTFRLGTGDGLSPAGGLVSDRDGNLYGATSMGDAPAVGGTIFKIARNGKESVLYGFTGGADGSGPSGDLLIDRMGNIYGTTSSGGAFNFGTVFKIDPSGHETVLYSFKGPLQGDGANPFAGVIRDAQGNLYGTTWAGGDHSNTGTVFKLDKAGNETLLFSFPFGPTGSPAAGLVRDGNGNLYGTTVTNPLNEQGVGTVFKITP